ncbi:cysteine proteinase [Periconia macrospinosa]|uniref:Cysteine proteinase n=1 Tax=Periconia macrospinosa TaxID=97972 RepID=A0A2V1EDR6_9PLEO|nr:cysteine proteinase [Periconia macrospinosa]
MSDAPETLEALQARHRKEQRDLVSRVTQKKKQATKKTRKGVNDECERLERELKERQAQEVAVHNGEALEQSEAEASQDDEAQEQDAELDGGAGAGQTNARLARRAAEYDALVAQAKQEAATMPDLREQERKRMEQQLSKHQLQCKEIRADGHCLYAAVADQMQTRELGLKPRIQLQAIEDGDLPDYKKVRYVAAGWIERNSDDFAGFMEEPLDVYLAKIRDTGEWGGHMELMALAKAYDVSINVLHGDGQVDKIMPGDGKEQTEDGARSIWLGYYRHSHGLGEHYNSLRKAR